MITTARRSSEIISEYTNGGVGLLERAPASYSEYVTSTPIKEESYEDAKARMQRNLDRLLNYDRYSEQVVEDVQASTEMEVVSEISEKNFQDEDIKPTSTTMQFGDGDVDQMYKEMNRADSEVSDGYKINPKGKLVLVLYALAVTVILALIVINTGMLATLSGANAAKTAELNAKVEQYNALQAEIDSISNSNYIIDVAENQYGMIKR